MEHRERLAVFQPAPAHSASRFWPLNVAALNLYRRSGPVQHRDRFLSHVLGVEFVADTAAGAFSIADIGHLAGHLHMPFSIPPKALSRESCWQPCVRRFPA